MATHIDKNMISRMINGVKPTTYIHESQMNTKNNIAITQLQEWLEGKNQHRTYMSPNWTQMTMHHGKMNIDDNAPGQKHKFQND
jgi:cobalamin biosynthesis Mg chelatase CobN